ncbi:MAG: VWA domain-containing protein, partial [Pirellulales bacterium]|nr:VWA domain-containing protein [Pirellulales bacterium]
KINQARRASAYVVDKLKARDRFTLINYDSKVETFRSELSEADKATRNDAKDYIDSMLAGGSTNIDEALSAAFQMVDDADGPVYVVFMTDGRPTVGERNAMKIADNARKNLREGTRLFSLGVGHDVNSRLLDKLASISLGQTMYVRPGEPLDQIVSNLYDRIGAPALVNANLQITVDGKEGRARQLYPAEMYDLFSGDQLVIVGRYRRAGQIKIKLSGDFLGRRQEYIFEDELPEETGSGKNAFVQRLWATRRIGQIIDEIDLHGENQELVDELIILSKRHGILTPYTAYLAEEQTNLNDLGRGRRIARRSLSEGLTEESGTQAFLQREFKSRLKSASKAAAPAADSFGFETNDRDSRRQASLGSSFGAGNQNGIAGGRGAVRLRANASQIQSGAVSESEEARPMLLAKRVKNIGTKTFFRRANRYVDADATEEQIKNAKKVERFSKAYFDLLEELGDQSKAYLAEESDLLVVLKGKAYFITAPAKAKEKS